MKKSFLDAEGFFYKKVLTNISGCDIYNISANDISGGDNMENNTPLTEAIYYILIAVKKPNHGYGIIQNINEMTKGRVVLGAGTLYGAINSMLDKKWIVLYSEEKESRKKKEYLLTEAGREAFHTEVERLKELVNNAELMEREN